MGETNTSSIDDEAVRCFDDLKRIWEGFSDDRIIPFCTPIKFRPTAVIVGISHSVFTRGVTPGMDSIAEDFSERVPDKHAFFREDFAPKALSAFADDMLEILDSANIEVDRNWMGTNRCPIQKTKLDEIRFEPTFNGRQKETDKRLRALFKAIAPEKILLVAKFAATLYYPTAESKTFNDLRPKTRQLAKGFDTTIIAIPYPN